jgi:uncharacterized membrane protein
MTPDHPLVARYLADLRAHAKDLSPTDREEVVGEIRNHISEALAAGKPLDAVLSSLGSAEALARAYAVELVLNRPAARQSGLSRFLTLAGLVMVGGLPTFVVVIVLGTVGISFIASGIAVFLAGVIAPFGLPSWVQMDIAPKWAVLIGPPLALGGAFSIAALVWYVRFAGRVIRRVLPRRMAG